MSDKNVELYEAYDIEIQQTSRGRGAILLKTNMGLLQLRQLDVNESRLNAEYIFKEKMYSAGFENIDRCIRNKEDELVSYDRYGNPFVLRYFFEGKECNITNKAEVELAVDNLARLHIAGKKVFDSTESDVHIRVSGDFRKRNAELKRVRNYIWKKRPRKEFEDTYIKAFDYFFGQALECEKNNISNEIRDEGKHMGYCHGMYNQHSVVMVQDENKVAGTINFDKFYVGNQLTDLYHFIRKAVEKNNYNFDVLENILYRYNEICPLNDMDVKYIYTLYRYPEKFYKISNQYINSSKNWISPKMLEKLEKVISDEDNKKYILENMEKIKLN